jgi:hypothetical protein
MSDPLSSDRIEALAIIWETVASKKRPWYYLGDTVREDTLKSCATSLRSALEYDSVEKISGPATRVEQKELLLSALNALADEQRKMGAQIELMRSREWRETQVLIRNEIQRLESKLDDLVSRNAEAEAPLITRFAFCQAVNKIETMFTEMRRAAARSETQSLVPKTPARCVQPRRHKKGRK